MLDIRELGLCSLSVFDLNFDFLEAGGMEDRSESDLLFSDVRDPFVLELSEEDTLELEDEDSDEDAEPKDCLLHDDFDASSDTSSSSLLISIDCGSNSATRL